ncbi:hypothetical protein [Luteococcus sp. OSA5]|uniref:hypothetical protein n=1 Tax=Luteococcus sp. OSA5 TaxID=3401630 RepID=UPI003B43B3CD
MTSQDASVAPAQLGIRQQPAVARRTARLLTQLRLACGVAVVGLVCNMMASRTLLRLDDTSRLWPTLANLASVLVLLVCAGQLYVWRQAQLEWTGVKDVSLMHLITPSALARWVAGVCGLMGPFAALQMIEQTSYQEAAHWWGLAGAMCTILATAFGGIHRFDPAGPPGVVPQQLHRGRQVVSDASLAAQVDPEEDTLVLRRQAQQD